jgi:hypothetical protein
MAEKEGGGVMIDGNGKIINARGAVVFGVRRNADGSVTVGKAVYEDVFGDVDGEGFDGQRTAVHNDNGSERGRQVAV